MRRVSYIIDLLLNDKIDPLSLFKSSLLNPHCETCHQIKAYNMMNESFHNDGKNQTSLFLDPHSTLTLKRT